MVVKSLLGQDTMANTDLLVIEEDNILKIVTLTGLLKNPDLALLLDQARRIVPLVAILLLDMI